MTYRVAPLLKILAFGPLTRSPEQGREGGEVSKMRGKIFSSFLDELDHLEQFKHFFFFKNHTISGGLAIPPPFPSWKVPPKVGGMINEAIPSSNAEVCLGLFCPIICRSQY